MVVKIAERSIGEGEETAHKRASITNRCWIYGVVGSIPRKRTHQQLPKCHLHFVATAPRSSAKFCAFKQSQAISVVIYKATTDVSNLDTSVFKAKKYC